MLGRYFSLTWHHADVGSYELHGHDFLQLVLLQEIERMVKKRDEDPTGFCIPLRDKPLPIYSTFPIADFSTHLGYPFPALSDAAKVRGEPDNYTQVTREAKVREGRRRSRVSDEGNMSPISDSFSYKSTTDSVTTSSPPLSFSSVLSRVDFDSSSSFRGPSHRTCRMRKY